MTSSAEQIRAYSGLALFSYGFRPFFLFGAAWAALAMALWLPMLANRISLPTAMSPVEWHSHEMLFGFVPAIVAGFLLTAVPNWTGRLPVAGARLMVLFALWLAGRAAIMVSAVIGPIPSAVIDLSFLGALIAIIAREIVAAGNLRNLKVLAAVALLFVANALVHLESTLSLGDGHGNRLGLGATLMLIMIIGGRIIPSFTRNWLNRRGPGRLPVPVDRLDLSAMGVSGMALASWVVVPNEPATAVLAVAAFTFNLYRLSRWAGERTLADPLVLVLHVSYAFVPLGFLLIALSIVRADVMAASAAQHAWTAGAIGMMTLAVMTRASLGHTGQRLAASTPVTLIFVAAFLGAVARVAAGIPGLRDQALATGAVLWVAAFAGFVAVFAPLLMKRRAP